MSINNDILNALTTELSSIEGLPVIYLPNNAKIPEQGISYLRPTLMPAKTISFTLQDEHKWSGLYQIDIYTQLKKGTAPALLIADAIADHFDNLGFTHNSVDIQTTVCTVSTAGVVESNWHCYVDVPYWCTYKP